MVKRGIATGYNNYFILAKCEIEDRGLPISQFKPILSSLHYLKATEIAADDRGYPAIDRQLFVLNCKLPSDEIERLDPNLYAYVQLGIIPNPVYIHRLFALSPNPCLVLSETHVEVPSTRFRSLSETHAEERKSARR